MQLNDLTQQEFESLWHDKAYGIYTRPALEIMFERRIRQGERSWAVLLDIDGIHNINAQYATSDSDGYAYTDNLLRTAFERVQIRSTDLACMGRYKSGDEIACLLRIQGNPQQFCERLLGELRAQGLSATLVYLEALPTFEETFKQASILLQANKKANNRGSVNRR